MISELYMIIDKKIVHLNTNMAPYFTDSLPSKILENVLGKLCCFIRVE